MKIDKLLTKKFVLVNNLISLTFSSLVIYVYKIQLDFGKLNNLNILISILIGIFFAFILHVASVRYKVWRNTSIWLYGTNKKDIFYDYFTFPILISVSEEILFRFIFLLFFGPIVSCIIFGLYHFRFNKDSITVALSSVIMGLFFIAINEYFGGLIYSIIVHMTFHIFARYLSRKLK